MSLPPSSPETRRPRAFRLAPNAPEPAVSAPEPGLAELPEPRRPPRRVAIEAQPDVFAREAAAEQPAGEVAIEVAQRRGMLRLGLPGWAGLFWSAIGGLVSIAVGLWVDRIVEDLFARVPGLGWVAVALAVVAVVALLALAIREILGVARQRRVAHLHKRLADAHAADDREAARAGLKDLAALYAHRPETARARQEIEGLTREIIDGRDLVDLAERQLMAPLDKQARREIADAAKRVAGVTAVSPRAILDLLFVIGQTVYLIRRIAEIYSGRPGLLGFLRLARSVGTHLAITGSMAVGDTLLQQVVGHGIAAKLSARLGEGILNGLLTTRVGLSAMAVCRPMPFEALPQPGVKEVAPFLFGGGSGE